MKYFYVGVTLQMLHIINQTNKNTIFFFVMHPSIDVSENLMGYPILICVSVCELLNLKMDLFLKMNKEGKI